MADLTPNNREEYWLQGMVDGQTTLEPNKRREYWYKEIVDAIGSGGGGGTGGGVLVATGTMQDASIVLDKIWSEISAAPFTVIKVTGLIAEGITSVAPVCTIGIVSDVYRVGGLFVNRENVIEIQFNAESASSYPVARMD